MFEKRRYAFLAWTVGCGDFNGRHFAVWGLAFKPNTEDLREAPVRTLLSDLFATGATATAHASVAIEAALARLRRRGLPDLPEPSADSARSAW
ncbi:MAG TPA: hypothetical protein DCY47_12620 [Candidatus Accumulibacter sp.]|nr:hypothetical protein [Accumulibacter sp.]